MRKRTATSSRRLGTSSAFECQPGSLAFLSRSASNGKPLGSHWVGCRMRSAKAQVCCSNARSAPRDSEPSIRTAVERCTGMVVTPAAP
eukprot:scaffold36637_cov30-Tisochrysis_lutea.AAC.2